MKSHTHPRLLRVRLGLAGFVVVAAVAACVALHAATSAHAASPFGSMFGAHPMFGRGFGAPVQHPAQHRPRREAFGNNPFGRGNFAGWPSEASAHRFQQQQEQQQKQQQREQQLLQQRRMMEEQRRRELEEIRRQRALEEQEERERQIAALTPVAEVQDDDDAWRIVVHKPQARRFSQFRLALAGRRGDQLHVQERYPYTGAFDEKYELPKGVDVRSIRGDFVHGGDAYVVVVPKPIRGAFAEQFPIHTREPSTSPYSAEPGPQADSGPQHSHQAHRQPGSRSRYSHSQDRQQASEARPGMPSGTDNRFETNDPTPHPASSTGQQRRRVRQPFSRQAQHEFGASTRRPNQAGTRADAFNGASSNSAHQHQDRSAGASRSGSPQFRSWPEPSYVEEIRVDPGLVLEDCDDWEEVHKSSTAVDGYYERGEYVYY